MLCYFTVARMCLAFLLVLCGFSTGSLILHSLYSYIQSLTLDLKSKVGYLKLNTSYSSPEFSLYYFKYNILYQSVTGDTGSIF